MIQRATFRNFKALREVTIELERFTVLVGPNASGKSSILQGLDLLLGSGRQQAASFGSRPNVSAALHARGSRGALEIEAVTEARGFRLQASPPAEAQGRPVNGGAWPVRLLTFEAASPEKVVDLPDTPRMRGEFPSATFLRLDAKRLAAPSTPNEQRPTMKPDGEGLASALAYLALNQPGAFADLKASLRRLFPYVRDVRFERVQMGHWGESLLFDFDAAEGVPAAQVSDGTLLVLGLLAAIYQINQPQLMLLDDLDHALHPTAQREVVKLLRALLNDRPGLQLLATTHSPYMLDEFSSDEVRLTNRLGDGSVALATLDDHPEFAKWKNEMGPGEFWSMVGEKWIGQAREEVAAR